MAWLDDRAWCHPKLVCLSDRAFRAYVNALSYSSGMALLGRLEEGHQRLMGSTPSIRRELVTAGLWDEEGRVIHIHDWKEHNAKRDERRAKDKERKREMRAARPQDSPQDVPESRPQSRRTLKEVKVVKEVTTTTAPNGSVVAASRSPHAGDVLAAVAEAFTAKGIPISARHRGILGKQARELIGSGFDFDAVVLACVISLKRGEPQNAHFIAADLVTAKAGERITRREYEKALQDEMEVGRGSA